MCVQSSALQSFSEHFRGTYSRHLNRCQGSRLAGEAWKQGPSVQNNKSIPEPILRTNANPLSSWSTTQSVWVLRSHQHEHSLARQHNSQAHPCLLFPQLSPFSWQIRGSIGCQCSRRSSAEPLLRSWRTLSSRTCRRAGPTV